MKLSMVIIILWLSILTLIIVKDKFDIHKQEIAHVVRPATK